jgi:RNA polymerase sigma factor (sigma-70 family)
MHDAGDMELLREYDRQGSEAAFAALVQCHVNLVYSAARRHVGIDAHAEEITQAVFIILARKAASLRADTILEGWLYETTRLTALSFLRGERRRQFREQEAYMQSTLNENSAPDAVWDQLAPLLDEAMARLGKKDREAVILRFFKEKSVREVAAALRINEAAAQRRILRALEKLRKYFSKHGVSSTTAIIAGTISANSVQAAPVALAKSVTAVAIAKGAAASGSTLTLIKGALKIMAWTKMKTVIVVGIAALLAVGITTLAVKESQYSANKLPQEIAKQAQATYAALSSYSDSGTIVAEGAGENTKTTFNIRLQRPKFYRVDWKSTGGTYTSAGVVWCEGKGDFLVSGPVEKIINDPPQRMNDMQQAFASAMGVSSSAATIPATFYKQNYGDVLGVPALGRTELTKQNDEKIGGVDCYVFTSKLDATKLLAQAKLPKNVGSLGITTTTFWIGKRDHLIHQIRTSMEGMSITMPHQSDDNIKTILERQDKPATPEAIATWRIQMDAMMKQAQGAKFVFTETHENISVNENFSPSDFSR